MAADVSVCLQGGIAGVSFDATAAGSFLSIVSGAIAQLVEHLHGMQGVRSSSLLGSINFDQPRKVTWEIIGRVSIYVSI